MTQGNNIALMQTNILQHIASMKFVCIKMSIIKVIEGYQSNNTNSKPKCTRANTFIQYFTRTDIVSVIAKTYNALKNLFNLKYNITNKAKLEPHA